jgi:hypothetical protein
MPWLFLKCENAWENIWCPCVYQVTVSHHYASWKKKNTIRSLCFIVYRFLTPMPLFSHSYTQMKSGVRARYQLVLALICLVLAGFLSPNVSHFEKVHNLPLPDNHSANLFIRLLLSVHNDNFPLVKRQPQGSHKAHSHNSPSGNDNLLVGESASSIPHQMP